jgi:hypothetical protein
MHLGQRFIKETAAFFGCYNPWFITLFNEGIKEGNQPIHTHPLTGCFFQNIASVFHHSHIYLRTFPFSPGMLSFSAGSGWV